MSCKYYIAAYKCPPNIFCFACFSPHAFSLSVLFLFQKSGNEMSIVLGRFWLNADNQQ